MPKESLTVFGPHHPDRSRWCRLYEPVLVKGEVRFEFKYRFYSEHGNEPVQLELVLLRPDQNIPAS
jgi:hypothetical protein